MSAVAQVPSKAYVVPKLCSRPLSAIFSFNEWPPSAPFMMIARNLSTYPMSVVDRMIVYPRQPMANQNHYDNDNEADAILNKVLHAH
jgi:hypothetical protein